MDYADLAHLRTLGNDDFDRRVVLAVDAVCLDDGSERILQDFKEHMVLDAHLQGESVIGKDHRAAKERVERRTRWLGTYMKFKSFGQMSCTGGPLKRP